MEYFVHLLKKTDVTQLEAVCNLKEKKNMAATTEANNSSSSGMGAMEDWRKKSGLSCSFIIFAALNLAMVIVGGDAVYLCKIQPMILIYLIGKLVYLWILF